LAEITIDGNKFDVDKLTDNAKAQLGNLQFVDQEIARTQASLAVLQTARNAYAQSLKQELEALGQSS
jgi:hypothetical protein